MKLMLMSMYCVNVKRKCDPLKLKLIRHFFRIFFKFRLFFVGWFLFSTILYRITHTLGWIEHVSTHICSLSPFPSVPEIYSFRRWGTVCSQLVGCYGCHQILIDWYPYIFVCFFLSMFYSYNEFVFVLILLIDRKNTLDLSFHIVWPLRHPKINRRHPHLYRVRMCM